MFDSGIIDPKMQLEEQNILDIETAQCEYDDNQPDSFDCEDNYDDDIFGHCDIDGKVSDSINKLDINSNSSHLNASIKEALNDINLERETVSYSSGLPSCGGAAAPSPFSSACNIKNGLLHLSHSVSKDISTNFPVPEHISKNYTDQEPIAGIFPIKSKDVTHNGPLGYFLHNNDYREVMQELHTSTEKNETREIVSDFVSVPPLSASAGVFGCNKKMVSMITIMVLTRKSLQFLLVGPILVLNKSYQL